MADALADVVALDQRIAALVAAGVQVVDPRQTYVAADVALERVRPGAVLWPGTRLQGPRTWVGARAEVGAEGPATLIDTVVGAGARIDSGFVHGAVLFAGARLGSSAHVRPATLLEEQASTAHAVGLKQSFVLAFATLGSLINFCDAVLGGGTSRDDHSEVGSGFIHFNFTPWGARGDKATASLAGDVVRGVFLREPRVFLGGSGGMVGPRRVVAGAVTAAGQVLRRDVLTPRLVATPTPAIDRPWRPGQLDRIEPRARANVEVIAQLAALRAWYLDVRAPRAAAQSGEAGEDARACVAAGVAAIEAGLHERVARLTAFVRERGGVAPTWTFEPRPACPTALAVDTHAPDLDHVAWVRSLAAPAVDVGVAWLEAVARAARAPWCGGAVDASAG